MSLEVTRCLLLRSPTWEAHMNSLSPWAFAILARTYSEKDLAQMPDIELIKLWGDLWNDYSKRLLLLVYSRYGKIQTYLGRSLEGLVQETITDVFSGNRRYPPIDNDGNERDVLLFPFLWQCIKGKISHLQNKRMKGVYINDVAEGGRAESFESQHIKASLYYPDFIRRDAPTDEQALLNALLKLVCKIAQEDQVLIDMTELLIEFGPELKPRQIAGMLEIPVSEVQNAKKRLKSKRKEFMKLWNAGDTRVSKKGFVN
jgi:hypothetical protein